jgi:hypothetical protein
MTLTHPANAEFLCAIGPYPVLKQLQENKQALILKIFSTIYLSHPTNHSVPSRMRALDVDADLSPFVQRTFALETPTCEAQPSREKRSNKGTLTN